MEGEVEASGILLFRHIACSELMNHFESVEELCVAYSLTTQPFLCPSLQVNYF